MKINDLVKIEWADALKKFVICHTLYGDMLESVENLKLKVRDRQILAPIRKIYQDMLDFAQAEGNDKNEKKQNRRRDDERVG